MIGVRTGGAMKAYFYNASARKHFNTAQLLESAMKGASDAGAECEFVNLFDYEFTGCRSCFACKIKNRKTNGVCVLETASDHFWNRQRMRMFLCSEARCTTDIRQDSFAALLRDFCSRLIHIWWMRICSRSAW